MINRHFAGEALCWQFCQGRAMDPADELEVEEDVQSGGGGGGVIRHDVGTCTADCMSAL